MAFFTGYEWRDKIEIEAIADHITSPHQCRAHRRRAPPGIARPDADDSQSTEAAPEYLGPDDHLRPCHSAGRTRRFLFCHDQLAIRAAARQRRRLGDTMAADRAEYRLGRIGQARRLLLEPRGIEKAQRQSALPRHRAQGWLVHLEVDGSYTGDSKRAEPGV